MPKRQKALDRICNKPPASDITWDELKAALVGLGFTALRGDGSRRKFFHEETKAIVCCHKPHPGSIVGKSCIRDVVETLTRYGLIEE